MRAVNLLPRDDPNRRTKTNVPVVVGVAGAVLSTALIGMMFMSASGAVHDRQQQLDALRAELAVVPPPVQQSSAAGRARRTEQKARVDARSSTAMSRRVAWDRVLREVTLVLPEDVWLLSLAAHLAGLARLGRRAGGVHERGADRLHARRLHLLAGRSGPRALPPDGRAGPLERPAAPRAR